MAQKFKHQRQMIPADYDTIRRLNAVHQAESADLSDLIELAKAEISMDESPELSSGVPPEEKKTPKHWIVCETTTITLSDSGPCRFTRGERIDDAWIAREVEKAGIKILPL